MAQLLKGLHVLLVEDDFLIMLDIKLILEDAGASVVTAASVREGLELSIDPYHVAILDIRLPDGEVFPVAGRRSPVAGRRSPVAGRRSPVAERNSKRP